MINHSAAESQSRPAMNGPAVRRPHPHIRRPLSSAGRILDGFWFCRFTLFAFGVDATDTPGTDHRVKAPVRITLMFGSRTGWRRVACLVGGLCVGGALSLPSSLWAAEAAQLPALLPTRAADKDQKKEEKKENGKT